MVNETCTVSIHGHIRSKERCKLKSSRAVQKNATLALQRGKRAEDLRSWERSYLLQASGLGKVAVAYQGYCYIFSGGNVFVTVFRLPVWFGKPKHFEGKERIRDYKKYCRNYKPTYEQN